MQPESLGIIGGGRITRILLAGLARAGRLPALITVSDTDEKTLLSLSKAFPGIRTELNNNRIPAQADIIIIALHPQAMNASWDDIAHGLRGSAILVSFAPKVKHAQITARLDGFDRTVRMIPNAPSIVNEGYNPVAFGRGVSADERKMVLAFFAPLGRCPEVSEDDLEAYAIITGMGPTYFWFQLAELHRLAESFGLSHDQAAQALTAMLNGAVKTMYESGLTQAEVMDLVPARPIGSHEGAIRTIYATALDPLFKKLKG